VQKNYLGAALNLWVNSGVVHPAWPGMNGDAQGVIYSEQIWHAEMYQWKTEMNLKAAHIDRDMLVGDKQEWMGGFNTDTHILDVRARLYRACATHPLLSRPQMIQIIAPRDVNEAHRLNIRVHSRIVALPHTIKGVSITPSYTVVD